jgi:hypothetical protein
MYIYVCMYVCMYVCVCVCVCVYVCMYVARSHVPVQRPASHNGGQRLLIQFLNILDDLQNAVSNIAVRG